MIGRSRESDQYDKSVVLVEAFLDRVATRAVHLESGHETRTRSPAIRAVGICACVTTNRAPNWLIYDEPGGALRWSRIADETEVSEIVEAQLLAEGHADPGGVLAWLRGDENDPWRGGDGWGDAAAARDLRSKMRNAPGG